MSKPFINKVYVMEWYHAKLDCWMVVECRMTLRGIQAYMREQRGKYRNEKFRIRKYVPERRA